MDKLQERAKDFLRLTDYEYKIILGRKGQRTELNLNFQKTDFAHLIGLHKLTDVLNGNLASEKVFNRCLSGKLTYEVIAKSRFFSIIENRFSYFDRLEEMIDSNETVYKCNTATLSQFSRIIADFEMKNEYDSKIFYLFLAKRAYEETMFCKSFIQEDHLDYTYRQIKMTLLYKEKINKITDESVTQYNILQD